LATTSNEESATASSFLETPRHANRPDDPRGAPATQGRLAADTPG
jgi:hypothetical protein